MKIERDRVEVTGGVSHGRTLGGPIALHGRQPRLRQLGGADEPVAGGGDGARGAPAAARPRRPRRHAEVRAHRRAQTSSSGPAPARPRRGLPAARSPRRSCATSASSVFSHVIQITGVTAPRRDDLTPEDFAAVDESPVRCLDPEASRAMVAEINRLRKANESLGGVFEVRAFGLVPGLGSHVSWEERLDGRLGMAILSIQAIKAVAIGDGIEVAGLPGSEAHDEIFYEDGRGYYRETNRSGGLEGGMTTGAPLVVRGSMKPLPTLTKPLRSVDIATHAARRGAARAHRLVHGAGRRRGGGGDGGVRARRRLPAQVRRRPHRRRPRRVARLRRANRVAAPLSLRREHRDRGLALGRVHRLHGSRQVDRRAQRRRGARRRPRSTSTA